MEPPEKTLHLLKSHFFYLQNLNTEFGFYGV